MVNAGLPDLTTVSKLARAPVTMDWGIFVNRIILGLAAVQLLGLAGLAQAAIKTEDVEYKQDHTTLRGFLAYDDAGPDKRAGILVIHEWWGHNEHARTQARKLAEAGHVGFALDMYGKGKLATHPKDAGAFMDSIMKAPDLMKARFDAALAYLKTRPQVDPARIAAVGYCFGGSVALTMARAGADLKAVATFHAALNPVDGPAARGKVKARLLVQTGGADPFIPSDQVAAFRKEMKEAGTRHEVKVYPAAKHSFTNLDADKAGLPALKYDAAVDQESWQTLVAFLKTALAN